MKELKVAISIGDLNGIGIQLILENHTAISQIVDPIYCIDTEMLQQASEKLKLPIPENFQTIENIASAFNIHPVLFLKKVENMLMNLSTKQSLWLILKK